MKEIVYFVLGAAIGATVALLFAPKSGAELRADLQATAEKDKARLQADWQDAMAKTHERLDQIQADLKKAPGAGAGRRRGGGIARREARQSFDATPVARALCPGVQPALKKGESVE